MKVAVCCIIKNENRYINEWIDHYLSIGFDSIIIYDNNDITGENPLDVINNNNVILINTRGQNKIQLSAYKHCYYTFKNYFDWIAFFDADEFLMLKNVNNIKDFLSNNRFDVFNCIYINWLCVNDNNKIKYVNKPLKQRMKKYDFNESKNFVNNIHVKSIIRTNIENFDWDLSIPLNNPHTPMIKNLFACNCNGIPQYCTFGYIFPICYDTAYLLHYWTKSLEEFIDKTLRGYPDQDLNINWKNALDNYFSINKFTEKKKQYIKDKLNIDYNI